MAETLSARVTRLENAMAQLAKAQAKLTKTVDHLAQVQAEAQVKLTNGLNHLAEAQARHETEAREWQREARERERRLDERIEKLVSAIGELIRRRGGEAPFQPASQ